MNQEIQAIIQVYASFLVDDALNSCQSVKEMTSYFESNLGLKDLSVIQLK